MTRDTITALLNAQARAWETGDLDAIMAHYAPDAVLIAPATRLVGAAAIRASFARALAAYTVDRITLTRVIIDGEDGALEWTWHETRRADGQRNTVDDAIIFTLRADKITHWREYFDTATHA
ncbi:MAG TPA: nuclear transport factor 2 family protein [Thermomicrobiales bacterium]